MTTVSPSAAERAAPAGRNDSAPRLEPIRRIDRRPGLPGGRALVGALLVVVAAVGVFVAYTDATGDPSTSYVVAATDLRVGDAIAAEDLELTSIDLPASVSARAFVSADELTGRVVVAPVAAGEVLQASAITDQVPPEAGTEVAITLPRENVATGRLEVGDRVDVFQTTEERTSTVVRGVQVIDLTVDNSDDLGTGGEVEVRRDRPRRRGRRGAHPCPARRRHHDRAVDLRRAERRADQLHARRQRRLRRGGPSGLMAGERFVVLGLAPVRSAWFRDVAKWATAAAIPVDFLKTVSVEEVRARLRSGRGISALLIDDGVVGLDRDLIDLAAEVGCAVIVVDSGRTSRAWSELGVAGVLPRELGRGELVELLSHVATPIARVDGAVALERDANGDAPGGGWRGSLVAVTGAPGAGRSTIAMALAQGFARDPRDADLVCLADLSLDADQGMLHDCPDVVPGVLELVDANRSGMPSTEETRSLTWAVEGRGYQLLLGLRRHRDWTALRPRAVEASLDGLRRCFRVTVADVDPDVEGEDECGSLDVEERNLLARAATRHADLVVIVGNATLTGVHHLCAWCTTCVRSAFPRSDCSRLSTDRPAVLGLEQRSPRPSHRC